MTQLIEINGRYYKPAKVVMLPTEKASEFYKYEPSNGNNLLYYRKGVESELSINIKPQHLYILSDDEIKEVDWYLGISNTIHRATSDGIASLATATPRVKKIITTTDKSLKYNAAKRGNEGDHSILSKCYNMQPLPQSSQSFIEKYISEYNKGNVITDVLVEYERNRTPIFAYSERIGKVAHSGFESEMKLKVNPKDNTITIRPVKNSWSREEVVQIVRDICNVLGVDSKYASDYIEENL